MRLLSEHHRTCNISHNDWYHHELPGANVRHGRHQSFAKSLRTTAIGFHEGRIDSSTGQACNTAMQIPELREMMLLQLPLYDLLVATQICKEWQDFILNSPEPRRRLLHGNLSFQYAARILQTERKREAFHKVALQRGYGQHPMPVLEWFFRAPQKALSNGEWGRRDADHSSLQQHPHQATDLERFSIPTIP
jgi:hypothetical protein